MSTTSDDAPLMTPPGTPSHSGSSTHPTPPDSPTPAYPSFSPHAPASTARSEAGSESYQHSDAGSAAHERELQLYRVPNAFSLLRAAAINLILPFVNGLMLGFGELFAHEVAFRLGWGSTRVFPVWRSTSGRTLGPGVEARRKGAGAGEDDVIHAASLE